MVQVLEENIKPVLVLNKSDLDFDRQSVEEQINHISNQIPVFFTSIHQPQTILRLRESISEGETVVFVGSSGVGKSSLVNALCEKSVLLTSDISLSTGKGRHTSTRREMVLMNDSGVLIDTRVCVNLAWLSTIQTHWPKYLKSLTMQNRAVSKIASISTNRVVLF